MSSGTVSFAGQTISGIGQQRIAELGIARTFQHVKLLPEMSVLENVALVDTCAAARACSRR